MIKVGSIIEILNHDSISDYCKCDMDYYMLRYPIGSRHTVLQFFPDTGEVEIHHRGDPNPSHWHTFFPGEYKLVE